jgi:hypothetical protein
MTLLAVAGCFMVLLGLLAIIGVVGPIARRVRRFRGRAIGKVIAIETGDPGSAMTSYPRAADIPAGPDMSRSYRLVVEFVAASTPYKAYSLWRTRVISKRSTLSRVGARKDEETTIGGVPFDAGQSVDVIYDPADPAMAVADDGGAYAQFALQVFIGLLLAIVGLLMLFAAGKLAWLGPGWRP